MAQKIVAKIEAEVEFDEGDLESHFSALKKMQELKDAVAEIAPGSKLTHKIVNVRAPASEGEDAKGDEEE